MTKQELQQKIYESGFEPPMWITPKGILFHDCNEVGKLNGDKPYYPCEWLWKRLPKEIECKHYPGQKQTEKYELMIIYIDGDCMIKYSRYDDEGEDTVLRFWDKDLHKALLDTFVWSIEKEYVKP